MLKTGTLLGIDTPPCVCFYKKKYGTNIILKQMFVTYLFKTVITPIFFFALKIVGLYQSLHLFDIYKV